MAPRRNVQHRHDSCWQAHRHACDRCGERLDAPADAPSAMTALAGWSSSSVMTQQYARQRRCDDQVSRAIFS